MAHHQKHQADANRRGSAMQTFLKMFNLSNAPTTPLEEEDVPGEADEPPDDQARPLPLLTRKESLYPKSPSAPSYPRRESLLTRAILGDFKSDDTTLPLTPAARGMSTASSHSTTSMTSTAELTSDADLTSPTRSVSPSPPSPRQAFNGLLAAKKPHEAIAPVVIAPVTKDDKVEIAVVGEAAVEKTLGRKRCIMFACDGGNTSDAKDDKTKQPAKKEEPKPSEAPPKRKCALTFMCPSRQSPEAKVEKKRITSPVPTNGNDSPVSPMTNGKVIPSVAKLETVDEQSTPKTPLSPQAFHEFASSQDEHDTWITKPTKHIEKLTLSDCMKKEEAIRQLGEEAEAEAEDEEREMEEMDEELDETTQEDDFAPSDESDEGNQSDNEEGFADSDDESDAGSDYRFWAPSFTTTATSTEHLAVSHFSSRGRSRASSLESATHSTSPVRSSDKVYRRRSPKAATLRPGTPELPDSTDFVCGTLDEDRPLEAAYIACREQKKRAKHVPIPQDIDPSFPTSDPEDDGDDGEIEDSMTVGGPTWLNEEFTDLDMDSRQNMRSPSAAHEYPFPVLQRRTTNPHRSPPPTVKRGLARSPPPTVKRGLARSPPPKKLFGHSPKRMRSPPPTRLRSPPASPDGPALGVEFGRLAQRPLGMRTKGARTSSLPRTPNPFFRNFNVGSPSISNVASGAVTPAVEDTPRADMHVRGPVDIVMGLEKKRQKRKEKFWRQHCRKAAKEQAIRRPVPGRGATRMRELGLECAERNRGYGLATGQQAQLVISL